MRKVCILMAMFVCCLAILGIASQLRAENDGQVVGPMLDKEYYPDMMEKAPSCKSAYDVFMKAANPLMACRTMNELNMKIEAQQEMIKDLSATKGCKDCKRLATAAAKDVADYQSKVNDLKAQCPDKKTQYDLAMSLDEKHKDVCKSCKNNWPGPIGPFGMNPCK